MNHMDNDAKFMEEKVLSNEPFELHSSEKVYLTTPLNHKVTTSLSDEDKAHKGISLCPKTPIFNQEISDKPCEANTSSSSSVSSPLPSTDCSESDTSDNGSPKTPKSVFDPFAPGPEEMELAPICKKVLHIPWKFTPRRLKFDDSDDCLEIRNPDCDIETISEEMILESVYTAILEAVIKMQTEAFLATKNDLPSCTARAKTPPGTKLTGNAEMCRNAPMKAAPQHVVRSFFTAVKALSHKEIHYGSYATSEQVSTSGDMCAICQEKMHTPILLRCKHIFCEDCVSEWFERERTCPLCRALVKPADLKSFGDGSTSLFFQLF